MQQKQNIAILMKQTINELNDRRITDDNEEQNELEVNPQLSMKEQINLYSHKMKKKTEQQQLTFYVDLPVFKEYNRIDLRKNHIDKRIFRQKSKILTKSIPQSKQQKSDFSVGKNNWKQSIERYVEAKKKSVEKHTSKTEIHGYPLMKLSKKNELLRKIKTNQVFQQSKPDLVQKLETEEMFTQQPFAAKKHFPSIFQAKTSIQRKLQTTQKNNKTLIFPSNTNETLLISAQESIQFKSKKTLFYKQVIQKANKSEKVLINFIGNYFRQKFCPERRYSYQIPYKQFDQNINSKYF